jgi:hypothetical protein
MRGATSYCGVPPLDTCLQELERTAKTGDGLLIENALVRVEREADRLTHTIET